MGVPTQKSDVMEEILQSLSPVVLGRKEAIINDICNWCGKEASEFRNPLSRKEYSISGFCQSCQDKTFGKD